MEAQKEFKLYYNSGKKRDRETLGYAGSLEFKLNDRDLSKSNLTPRQFAELAGAMNISVHDLIDQNADYYLSDLKDKNFSDDEWLTMLNANPDLVKTPIAILEKRVYYVKSPFELIPEDIEIEGITAKSGEKSESSDNDTI